MSEKILAAVAGLLAILIAGLFFFWEPELPERPLPQAVKPSAGDFTLQSDNGPVSLKDYRGRLVLVYFGYTYCPDICPTSLALTSEALRRLTPEEQARVASIFISVDPERDTPARLKEYVEFFHPGLVGLTGSKEALAETAFRYGVFFARQKLDSAGNGYVIDHTADTYVIGADGQLLDKIAHATPPDQVVTKLRQYLKSMP